MYKNVIFFALVLILVFFQFYFKDSKTSAYQTVQDSPVKEIISQSEDTDFISAFIPCFQVETDTATFSRGCPGLKLVKYFKNFPHYILIIKVNIESIKVIVVMLYKSVISFSIAFRLKYC